MFNIFFVISLGITTYLLNTKKQMQMQIEAKDRCIEFKTIKNINIIKHANEYDFIINKIYIIRKYERTYKRCITEINLKNILYKIEVYVITINHNNMNDEKYETFEKYYKQKLIFLHYAEVALKNSNYNINRFLYTFDKRIFIDLLRIYCFIDYNLLHIKNYNEENKI